MLKLFPSCFVTFVLVLCSGWELIAQSPQPTATPVDSGVVKITTNLIQLDVTVTDSNGRVITDLKQDEIEVYENGQKQNLTGFSFVANPQPKLEKNRKASSGVPEPPLVLRPDQVKRTVALVVDDLTLSFQSADSTRRALRKFVDEQMLDGDLVAIIRTGAGIGALQQFTSNKQQLYAAIERVKWNAQGVGRLGSFDPIEPTPNEVLIRAPGKPKGEDGKPIELITKEAMEAERASIGSWNDFRENLFNAGTLGALKYIVNGMAELPGRKSVIMFSDGLKIFSRQEGGSFAASRTMAFLQGLVEEANRKSVIFYPVDARGLVYTGFTAADQIPNTQGDPLQQSYGDRLGERSTEIFDSQQGLFYLADQTGGFAYTDRNDLSAGVQKVLEDQSYYLVAYQPDDETFDAEKRKFNKIEIKVRRKDVKVRHRSGFFVGEEDKGIVVDLNFPTKLMRALTSPFALNGINVKLNALVGHSASTGYYVHSFLHINAANLTFTKQPDGDYQAGFDILAISYGDNGAAVDKNNSFGTTKVKAEHLDRLRREGIAYSFIFPVKKPGAYQMRVALIDKESREVGSANQFVNVPDIKKEPVTLSGIVLENVTKQYFAKMTDGSVQIATRSAKSQPFDTQTPKFSTAVRQFPRGTVLRFGIELLGAKAAGKGDAPMTVQSRVFHDRKMVFESRDVPLAKATIGGPKEIVHTDAVELGEALLPGDYVLQVIVAHGPQNKRRFVTQNVQFEVVE